MPIGLADTLQPSWDLVADGQLLFEFPFMRHAFLAGTLVAVVAGLIGYFMVLRGESFAGHSLANVGFAGATGAALFGIPPVLGLFAAGVVAALGMQGLNRQRRQNDIAVGAIFVAALALGYLFIHLATAEYAANVYTILFGNVLGVSDQDLQIIEGVVALALGTLVVIGRPLLFASLDPDVAAARGVPVRALGLAFMVLLALVVAVAVQVVGVLLIFALLVTPAAIAQQMVSRPALALGLTVLLALLFTWLGLAIGYFTPYPVSFFITTLAFVTYVVVLGGRFVGRWRAAQPGHLALVADQEVTR